MVGAVPGFIPKTALVASRVVYYPFTIPQKLNDSATLTGAALNGMVKGVNASIGNAYASLQPKGPAKWLLPLFAKVDAATAKSDHIAQRNKAVFWDPFSQGVEGVGRALASPGAYYYLRKAGMENPGQDAIKAVLNMPIFSFPSAEGGGGGGSAAPPAEAPPAEAPPAEAAPPTGAAEAAAEGAAQAAA